MEIPVTFTLDTICPWTFLAKRRLAKAVARVHESHPDVRVVVKFLPYQLYPEMGQDGEDKATWYRSTRYGDSEEKWRAYTTLMSAYGVAEGIDFDFEGIVANTLPAHRTVYHFQESGGPELADKLVESLYKLYFEKRQHPSSKETLLQALTDAGVDSGEAEKIVEDEDEDLMDTKMLLREQTGNGVDSVPYIVFEGKRRDFTLVGAKEVDEYVKTLEQCIKEGK